MPIIYVTGCPGSGKSTLYKTLKALGYTAYGGAEDDLAAFYDNQTRQKIDRWVTARERTPEWRSQHTWKIDRKTVERLKREAKNKPLYLCALTKNEPEILDLFDKIIVLELDEATMRKRLAKRTDNDIGRAEGEIEAILDQIKVKEEQYLHQENVVKLDARRPVKAVVDDIIAISAVE